MDQIKMVVDSVWLESKKPLVIGVSMQWYRELDTHIDWWDAGIRFEDEDVRLSFQVTGEHYLNENYQLRELFEVTIEPI